MRPVDLPPELLALAATQHGLVSSTECDGFGVGSGTRARLVRTGRWRRLARGVYDVTARPLADVPWRERHQRAAVAALLSYGPDAIAVGPSALALRGVQGLPHRAVPEVALPGGASATGRLGVRLRQFEADLAYGPVGPGGRWQAATVHWALAQAVPELPRNYAVATMDSALFQQLLDPAGLEHAHALAAGRRGVARTHEWWALADGRAESPNETHVRLDCADCGVAAHDLQVPVWDASGILIGRGDLGWRKRDGRWLMAEVDGEEVHSAVAALFHDRHRQNLFLANGADTLRFTWRDTRVPRHCGSTVARLLAA